MVTLTELLRAHPDHLPRTPCTASVAGELVTVQAVLKRTAVIHPPDRNQPDERYLVLLEQIEIDADVKLVDRFSHAERQVQEGSVRGRALSRRGRRTVA